MKRPIIVKPQGTVWFTSLLLIVALMTGFTHAARAANNWAVTNTDDSGPGSLRQAIADAAVSGDTIVFHVKGTITLITELLIDKNLTIYGGNTDDITISGNDVTRVFKVTDHVVIFDSLTITNGKATDGCSGGRACGGGIAIIGSSSGVVVTNSMLENNVAEGGIGDMGGAIYSEGGLVISGSTFRNNSSDHGGAVLKHGGEGVVKYSSFLDNTAENGGAGGAYYNSNGIVSMEYSSFSGNRAIGLYAKGGAVYSYSNQSSSAMNIVTSTFNGNTAELAGGAFYNAEGDSVIINSTLSGNSAESGGGIYNNGTNLTIMNTTITQNDASISGGGIVSSKSDAYNTTVAALANSIVSGNTVNDITPDDLQLVSGSGGDSFISAGYNLIGTAGPGITAFQDGVNGDQLGIDDPKLGPLVDNGGENFTHLPALDSAAVDTGGNCATANPPVISDQRGLPRTDPCEVGSVELLPARLTVVKNTVGGDGSFDFVSINLPGGNFAIATTGNTGSKEYLDLTPGAYDLAETVPAGWQLQTACDNGQTPDALQLNHGDNVTCTFTNTKLATISINKMTFAAGGSGFEFSQNIDGSGNFTLDDQGIQTFTDVDPSQAYTVTETDPAGLGYTLLGLTCSDQDSTVNVALREITINVDPGENVVCIFTNVEDDRIIIEKVTVPAGVPDVFNFSVTSTPPTPDFTLAGGEHKEFPAVPSATYTVTEADPTPAGFDLTAIDCNGGSGGSFIIDLAASKVDFALAAGETIHCAYTNTQRGQIIVDKVTVPAGDVQSFEFVLVGGPDSVNQSFALTDTATPYDSGQIKPGTYSLAETPLVAGWDLSSAQCSDGSTPGAIDLDPGEIVTCTFTNTRHMSLTTAVTGTGNGVVTSNPAGIDCGDNCTAEFAGGSTVTLTAVPENDDSAFVGWSGDCSGTGVCSITMDQPHSVTATFEDVSAFYVVPIPSGGAAVFNL